MLGMFIPYHSKFWQQEISAVEFTASTVPKKLCPDLCSDSLKYASVGEVCIANNLETHIKKFDRSLKHWADSWEMQSKTHKAQTTVEIDIT